MRRFLSRLLDGMAWRHVANRGQWFYEENRRTGARRAIRIEPFEWQPLDRTWLRGGQVID